MSKVSIEEMIAVMEHYKNGGEVEFSMCSEPEYMPWKTAENPLWDWFSFSYRIKDDTPSDGVPWEAINPRWKWAAKDGDGGVWLFENKPYFCDSGFWDCMEGEFTGVTETLLTYIGDDSKYSLRKRPY